MRFIFLLFTIPLLFFTPKPHNETRLNVLFIAVDDLRPELNCYGQSHIYSPNFDRLANSGMVFQRAYCQQAVCAPSRNGVLTGLRPDALRIYDLGTFFRETVPDVITLPQHFTDHGYIAESLGKISHIWHGNRDDTLSWSKPPWNPWHDPYLGNKIMRNDTIGLEGNYPTVDGKRLPYHVYEGIETDLNDVRIAEKAVERLEKLKDSSFFLAVGFLKPHLPFIVPQKYWDLYRDLDIQIPPKNDPENAPAFALNRFGELRRYHQIPSEGYVSDEIAEGLIRGYYACVSYIDDQLGRILDKLDALGLSENTVVVLWGDHGWKLGEYGDWCKHTAYELDTRSVLLMRTPDMQAKGESTNRLVEYIDIYPSVCEAAGLPKPDHLMGKSFTPLLDNPDQPWKKGAISQWPKRDMMGYSLRTERYRYVRWQKKENPEEVVATELYDHKNDPGETKNLISPKYDLVKKELNALLQKTNQ